MRPVKELLDKTVFWIGCTGGGSESVGALLWQQTGILPFQMWVMVAFPAPSTNKSVCL